MEKERNLLSLGYDTLENDKKLNKIITYLDENYKSSGVYGYLLGFEKGMKISEEENEESLKILDKIDSKIITETLDNIFSLNEYLKRNSDDIYIKYRIIANIANLTDYINNIVSKGDME